MGLGHSPRIVTDGLVLCLDAANKRSYGGSGTTWTDLKGNNNGIAYNGCTYSDENGGILIFDGTDENLRFSSATFNSIEMWCYRTETLSGWLYLFDARTGMSSGYFASLGIWNGWSMYLDGEPVSNGFPPQNQWSHVYIYSNDGNTYTDDITFFSRYTNGDVLGINVGQIRLYDRTLTQDEIRQNYLATKERYA